MDANDNPAPQVVNRSVDLTHTAVSTGYQAPSQGIPEPNAAATRGYQLQRHYSTTEKQFTSILQRFKLSGRHEKSEKRTPTPRSLVTYIHRRPLETIIEQVQRNLNDPKKVHDLMKTILKDNIVVYELIDKLLEIPEVVNKLISKLVSSPAALSVVKRKLAKNPDIGQGMLMTLFTNPTKRLEDLVQKLFVNRQVIDEVLKRVLGDREIEMLIQEQLSNEAVLDTLANAFLGNQTKTRRVLRLFLEDAEQVEEVKKELDKFPTELREFMREILRKPSILNNIMELLAADPDVRTALTDEIMKNEATLRRSMIELAQQLLSDPAKLVQLLHELPNEETELPGHGMGQASGATRVELTDRVRCDHQPATEQPTMTLRQRVARKPLSDKIVEHFAEDLIKTASVHGGIHQLIDLKVVDEWMRLRAHDFFAKYDRLYRLVGVNADGRNDIIIEHLYASVGMLFKMERVHQTSDIRTNTYGYRLSDCFSLLSTRIIDDYSLTRDGQQPEHDTNEMLATCSIHQEITQRDMLVECLHMALVEECFTEAMTISILLHRCTDADAVELRESLRFMAHRLEQHTHISIPTEMILQESETISSNTADFSSSLATTQTQGLATTLSTRGEGNMTVRTPGATSVTSEQLREHTNIRQDFDCPLKQIIPYLGLHEILDNTEKDEATRDALHALIARFARFAELMDAHDNTERTKWTGPANMVYARWMKQIRRVLEWKLVQDRGNTTVLEMIKATNSAYTRWCEEINNTTGADTTESSNGLFKACKQLEIWDKRTYAEACSFVSPGLIDIIHQAEPKAFLSESYQNMGNSPQTDLEILLSSTLDIHNQLTQFDLLLECLELATREGLYKEAMTIILVVHQFVDRFGDLSVCAGLQLLADFIVMADVAIYYPPQLQIWSAKTFIDFGMFQAGEADLNNLLELTAHFLQHGEIKPGTWAFNNKAQATETAARVQLQRGKLRRTMGLWMDAAIYFTAVLELINSISDAVNIRIECLDSLIEIVQQLWDNDFSKLREKIYFGADDPITQAYVMNGKMLEEIKRDNNNFFIGLTKRARIHSLHPQNMNVVSPDNLRLDQHVKQVLACVAHSIQHALENDLFHDMLQNTKIISADMLLALARVMHTAYLCCHQLGYGDQATTARGIALNLYRDVCSAVPPSIDVRQIGQLHDQWRSFHLPEYDQYFENPRLRDRTAWDFVKSNGRERNRTLFPTRIQQQLDTISVRNPTVSVFKQTSAAHKHMRESNRETYTSTLPSPMGAADGFRAPWDFIGTSQDAYSDPSTARQLEESNLAKSSVYEAIVWKYHVLEKRWGYRKTLVYVSEALDLTGVEDKGVNRQPIKLRYLDQENHTALYVGKIHKRRVDEASAADEVVAHEMSRQYLAVFNRKLQNRDPTRANKVRMVPVVHVQILGDRGHILEMLNVEPYISHEDFTKVTNNAKVVVEHRASNLLLAYSHFTWSQSDGQLMVTDIQGWFPDDQDVAAILTDPAVHSVEPHLANLGGNRGETGMNDFWTGQHKECNEICHLLGLERPQTK